MSFEFLLVCVCVRLCLYVPCCFRQLGQNEASERVIVCAIEHEYTNNEDQQQQQHQKQK